MDKKEWQQIVNSLALLTQIGIIIIVSIGLGFLGGYYLDKYLGTEVIFTIIGTLIGIISGFYTDFKIIMRMIKED